MEGYEQSEVGAVEVAVQHDPDDNEAMLSMSSARGAMTAWLNPDQTAELIRMLQRMQKRQVIEGASLPPVDVAMLDLRSVPDETVLIADGDIIDKGTGSLLARAGQAFVSRYLQSMVGEPVVVKAQRDRYCLIGEVNPMQPAHVREGQNTHARQVVGGDGVPVPDECEALSLLTKDLTATADAMPEGE